MVRSRSYGIDGHGKNLSGNRVQLHRYIALKLAALGLDPASESADEFLSVAHDLLAGYQEQSRLLSHHQCPTDERIQDYLDRTLAGLDVGDIRLPKQTFVLDRHGLARELSLPAQGQAYDSPILASRRLPNGVLHNPRSDRRTTKGVFHIAAGGLPVPADKREVPLVTYGRLLHHALHSVPDDLLQLPFTAGSGREAHLHVSLLLRPLVRPAIPGQAPEKRMEVRFFAPGSLVANLDFVESIFGNAGDPYLPDNDAGLDVEHWTGHTGCVILAPHLLRLTKRELGLPHKSTASERQLRDQMYYDDADEPYNGGTPFKITCRDQQGVMVTLIADNYFGYCKKEVKTQIGYAANLGGQAEEEHAGGALAFPRWSLGNEFHVDSRIDNDRQTMATTLELLGERVEQQPEGHAIDRLHPQVVYVPEDVTIDVGQQRVAWGTDDDRRSIKLLPNHCYMHPSGYKIHLKQHPGAPSWRLVGTAAIGTFCHKPCTVSGGGKSEISKDITDAVIYGPIFVADLEDDFALIDDIVQRDYSDRLLPELRPDYDQTPSRPILSPERSLGSVIKMFTPSAADFTADYNRWLDSVPGHIWPIIFVIKRFHRPDWGDDWRSHFTVDIVNGDPGHELKYHDRKVVGSYLRVGLRPDGSWRTFKLRQDFAASLKVQMEDDISASTVVPASALGLDGDASVKLVENCEHRLFQRPDEAVHRGMDKQTEADMAEPGLFASNYEPLDADMLRAEVEDVINFSQYSGPMQRHLAAGIPPDHYIVSSACPRIVDGRPTKNPRYLQVRPDIADPVNTYIAEIGERLHRRVPLTEALVHPVDAVLPGRRNNPPDKASGIKALAVYGPIHFQELPELFMDFIASLTGKSPSTTGAGSEGALTKGPFNALPATADLNNALIAYIITGHHGFSTAAGHIGPDLQVDHDISMLIPEIWCRMQRDELDPERLIAEGHLEAVRNFDFDGRPVLASRLGYRITAKFVHTYFGRIFDSPAEVFEEAILRPETQDLESFVDGVDNIVAAQQRVAQLYLDDGSIDSACPPLQALLTIMATGAHNGKTAEDPAIRQLFTRQYLLSSDWYRERLWIQQHRDIALWQGHVRYLETFINRPSHEDIVAQLDLPRRLAQARAELTMISNSRYLEAIRGTLGADPIGGR